MKIVQSIILSAMITLGACDNRDSDGTTNAGKPNTDEVNYSSDTVLQNRKPVSEMSAEELINVGDKFEAMKTALIGADVTTAERLAEAYLNELDNQGPSVAGVKIREHFNESGVSLHRQATIVLAKRRLLRVEDDASTRYLLGLVHTLGQSVSVNIEKAIEYWDHPSMKSNGAVQYRLYEIYSDTDSDFYDSTKSSEALKASKDAGYEPK